MFLISIIGSIGDLFAYTTMSKAGYTQMAFSAVFSS